jgi:hypothetical protein
MGKSQIVKKQQKGKKERGRRKKYISREKA